MNKEKNNLTAKILSLIIATILWSYVMGIENPDWPREYKNINVALTNMEALDRQNLILMEPDEVKINVSVVGKKSDMKDFTAANNIVAKIDLTGYSEGQTKAQVIVTLKNSASTVKITKYEPSEVLVNIDKIVTEEKKVNIKIEGEVPEDYTSGTIVSKPQTILVRGARTWVNRVSDVFVTVNMADRVSTSNITLPVHMKDQNGNDVVGLSKIPSVVDIDIPIFRKATLPIEVVLENELPKDYVITELTTIPENITIKGGNIVADLRGVKTKPIDINQFLENSSYEIELDLVEDTELLDPNQKISVSAKIEKLDTKELIYDLSEIGVHNLADGLILDNTFGTVRLSIKATESVLDNINKESLKPYIDLNGLIDGEHYVDVRVDSIFGVEVGTESVLVNLIRR